VPWPRFRGHAELVQKRAHAFREHGTPITGHPLPSWSATEQGPCEADCIRKATLFFRLLASKLPISLTDAAKGHGPSEAVKGKGPVRRIRYDQVEALGSIRPAAADNTFAGVGQRSPTR